MKTLKKLSAYLKDNIRLSRGGINWLKNEKGKISFTNGNYAIVTVAEDKEAIALPELFAIDVKKTQGEVKEHLINGYIVKSPLLLDSSSYPSFEPILKLHDSKPKTITLSLDAESLLKIAAIISKDGKRITLEITDNMSTIKVTADKENSFGLLMPLKPNWAEVK